MDIKYYQNIAWSVIERDKAINEFYDKVDTAISGGNELPSEIKKLPWMVHFKSTSIHDAYAAARRAIVASKARVNVLPPAGNKQTGADAEKLERILEYNYWLANRRSSQSPLSMIVDHAIKYMAVAIQIKDVEHEYKGAKGPRIDAMKQNGRFIWSVHDPRNVHARFNDGILEDVVLAQLNTVQEIVDLYGEDNPGVQKMIGYLQSTDDMKGKDWRETNFAHYIYTDYEKKVVWVSPGETVNGGSQSDFVIMNAEHKLGFLPWVYNKGDDPLLKAAVDAELLDHLNILLSMRYALIAATVSQARSWSRTPSGDGVEIDYSNPDAQVQLRPGEDYGVTQPAQIDNNIYPVIDSISAEISNTTAVSRILSSMESVAGNTPYSTINAIMQAALASLIEVRQLCEKSLEDGMYQMLNWVVFTKMPIGGRRLMQAGMYDNMMNVGAYLQASEDDFSKDWYITVQLRADSPMDRQERMTFAINIASQLQLPRAWAMEYAGLDIDPNVSFAQFQDEQMQLAQLEAQKQAVVMQAQMMLQNQQMQAQTQIEQQAQQGPPIPEQSPDIQSRPGYTREAATGRAMNGAEIAGG